MLIRTMLVDKALAELIIADAWTPMSIKMQKVCDYADQMKNKQWSTLLDHSSIIVRSGDCLKNGQHRLSAVIMSDTQQVFRVAILPEGYDVDEGGQIYSMEERNAA